MQQQTGSQSTPVPTPSGVHKTSEKTLAKIRLRLALSPRPSSEGIIFTRTPDETR